MKKVVFTSIFALSTAVCAAEETSVLNQGNAATTPVVASETVDAPAVVPEQPADENSSCEAQNCRRYGVVRRVGSRTAQACRKVGRAVVRPFRRVFGGRSCCR